MNIQDVDGGAIVSTNNIAFTYQVSETPRDFYNANKGLNDLDWNDQQNYIGDYKVYPYGVNDDLPDTIKQVVQNNYIAPGILKKKTQLIWGLGPILYTEKFVSTEDSAKRVRIPTDDDEIMNWLESWQYEDYLIKAITDYQHIEGVFSRFEQSKGSRIGKNFISKIHHMYPDRVRLASLRSVESNEATHAVATDWSFSSISSINNYKAYNLFDFTNQAKYKNSVLYSNMYSFCTDYYTVPDLYGSLEWLRRSTAVPLIFKALSENSINIKYHIVSPQAFWDRKEEDLKANCTTLGLVYRKSMLEDYKRDFLKKIADVLGGDMNTGKYLHTSKEFTVEGSNLIEHGWKIEAIEQNIKDFVTAQIAISQRADHSLASGLNLHAALGNVSESGKSDSGSEQIYALKTFLQTGIDIPEMIIMKAINAAIKVNWPTKKLKLGFYHETPEKEQDINPKNRIINN